jgi:hypothetical protein
MDVAARRRKPNGLDRRYARVSLKTRRQKMVGRTHRIGLLSRKIFEVVSVKALRLNCREISLPVPFFLAMHCSYASHGASSQVNVSRCF